MQHDGLNLEERGMGYGLRRESVPGNEVLRLYAQEVPRIVAGHQAAREAARLEAGAPPLGRV